ncbi:MAG: hypothetical protein GEV10_18845 [Streptosporangiales bacterium]|nr:hypothetical protein [Streptosporangiales bacterium]
MSWSEDMVARAFEARKNELPAEVAAQTKRIILDSIGCMYGAADTKMAAALVTGLPDLGAGEQATLLGQARRAGIEAALLFNGGLLRYLDLNDVQSSERINQPRHGHNSEFLPVVLALAERQDLSGREVVAALSRSFDLATAFTECVTGPSLEERGWNMDLRAAFVVPVVAGQLLGMSEAQIVHAVGISGSRSGVLGILDSDTEENSMAKNLRFPFTALTALYSTFLAKAGVSGPVNVLEGHAGFASSVLAGDFDPAPLSTEYLEHRVLDAILKNFASCFATHGHLTATLALVTEHDIRPDQVERVDVLTTTRGVRHTGQPVRRKPTTKETADHSAFYVQATLIRERRLGPEQYKDGRMKDPEVHELMDRVFIEPDERFDSQYPAAEVRITLKDGRQLTHVAPYALGHRQNPMSDAQIEDKYFGMTVPHVGQERAERMRDLIWRLDELDDLEQLFTLLRGSESRGS